MTGQAINKCINTFEKATAAADVDTEVLCDTWYGSDSLQTTCRQLILMTGSDLSPV